MKYAIRHRSSRPGAEWPVRFEWERQAIADRNGNRGDRETGLRPKDESGGAQRAIAQRKSA